MRVRSVTAGILTVTLFLFGTTNSTMATDRNPFKFGYQKIETPPENKNTFKKLTTILVSQNIKIAIINGHPFNVGDHIDGAVITEITIESVTTMKDGSTKVHLLGVAE
ncbi:hypothetical protein MNBD_NITROSPINAE01-1329 [hydrothermal vent metagenome]|uniref:Uncharacterized protein n=1 Tax=hydrothermal vent metagenome TaxID=652676 RepID=A0A3B1BEW3_9ZZZZ